MANKKVSQLTSKPSVLVTDLFPIADPSTGQLYKTTISDLGTAIGSGVSSVNGLVGAVVLDTDDIQELVSPTNKWFTDTRARAALSASSPLAYNSGTGVFSIPAATSSQNGYLTSTDWTTFNSKQAALSGTGFVKISGTTISYDNSTYSLDSAVVKLTGNQTIAGVKTFTTGIVADVTTGGTQGFASTNSSTSGSSIFLQNNSTSVGNAIGINNTSTADGISIGNDTSGRAIYISNATASGSGKGISIDNYNGGIGIEVGSDSTADAIKVLHLSGRAFNIQSSGGGYGVIINNTTASTSAPFTIQKQGSNRITFTDAGAGTFVSTISAAGATLTGALSGTSATFSGAVELGGTQLVRWGLDDGSANARTWGIRNGYNASGDFVVLSSSTNNTTLNTVQLQIARSGAATFSSSVTATLMGVGISSLSSWGSPFSVTQYPYGSYVGGTTSGAWVGGNNNYYDGSTYRYVVSDYATLVTQGGGDFYIRTATTGTAGNAITWNERFRVTNAGNVGIGTTAPSTKLTVFGDWMNVTDGTVNVYFGSDGSGGQLGTVSNHYQRFVTNNTERMRITSAGLMLLGATSSYTDYATIQITGDNKGIGIRDSDGFYRAIYNQSGTLYFWNGSNEGYLNTAGAWVNASDISIKKEVKNIQYGLNEVLRLSPKSYKMISNDLPQIGFIAQEVAEVLPELVEESRKGMKGLSYGQLTAVLVKAVQELKAELDTLKNK